jgi:hypothetical protein
MRHAVKMNNPRRLADPSYATGMVFDLLLVHTVSP